jgi:hypothetical protein
MVCWRDADVESFKQGEHQGGKRRESQILRLYCCTLELRMAKSALTIQKVRVPKSKPVPAILSAVNGYTDRLKIYQIPASPEVSGDVRRTANFPKHQTDRKVKARFICEGIL